MNSTLKDVDFSKFNKRKRERLQRRKAPDKEDSNHKYLGFKSAKENFFGSGHSTVFSGYSIHKGPSWWHLGDHMVLQLNSDFLYVKHILSPWSSEGFLNWKYRAWIKDGCRLEGGYVVVLAYVLEQLEV